MVSELHSTESKTQVYGSLHTFLQENKEETNDISKSLSLMHYSLHIITFKWVTIAIRLKPQIFSKFKFLWKCFNLTDTLSPSSQPMQWTHLICHSTIMCWLCIIVIMEINHGIVLNWFSIVNCLMLMWVNSWKLIDFRHSTSAIIIYTGFSLRCESSTYV